MHTFVVNYPSLRSSASALQEACNDRLVRYGRRHQDLRDVSARLRQGAAELRLTAEQDNDFYQQVRMHTCILCVCCAAAAAAAAATAAAGHALCVSLFRLKLGPCRASKCNGSVMHDCAQHRVLYACII